MPMSSLRAITDVLACVDALEPKSVLDVGCGWGQYGFLFRLHIDADRWCERLNGSLRGPSDFRLDAVEPFKAYLTDLHGRLYDEIIMGDIREELSRMREYDVIFLGGLIEHFGKEEGRGLLRSLMRKARKGVVVLTPYGFMEQGAVCGNEAERHRSGWLPEDFQVFPYTHVAVIGETGEDLRIVAVICKSEGLKRRVRWVHHPVRRLIRQLCSSLLGPTHGTRLFLKLWGLRELVRTCGRKGAR